jgi:hypothetical protein
LALQESKIARVDDVGFGLVEVSVVGTVVVDVVQASHLTGHAAWIAAMVNGFVQYIGWYFSHVDGSARPLQVMVG